MRRLAPYALGVALSACGQALDPKRDYEAHRNGTRVMLRSSTGRRLADCGRAARRRWGKGNHEKREGRVVPRPRSGHFL